MTFSRIELGETIVAATDFSGGSRQEKIYLDDSQPNSMFDKAWLRETQMLPWLELQTQGTPVVVGETGTPKTSPHTVYLAWLRDNLENWKEAGWGWALWNFRGEFGILDSERDDVEYEEFHGHKLDRKLLNLLQEFQ